MPAPSPRSALADATPSLYSDYRPRLEEIGDSFDIARVAAKTCRILKDLTQAQTVAFYCAAPATGASAYGWKKVEQVGITNRQTQAPENFSGTDSWYEMALDLLAPRAALSPADDSSLPSWLPSPGEGFALACKAQGDLLGLAIVWGGVSEAGNAEWLDLLEMIAFQAAQAVEHARWFEFAREADSRSQSLIATANALILGLDLKGRVTLWNDKATSVLGYSREEILGKSFMDLLEPDRRGDAGLSEKARACFEAALDSTEGLSEFEAALRDARGKPRYIAWTTSRLSAADGRGLGLYAIGQDLTRRKRLEHDLATSEKRYRDLVETTHDIYWILKSDTNNKDQGTANPEFGKTRIAFLNRTFLGREREGLVNGPVESLASAFTPESWERFATSCKQVLGDGKPVRRLETEHVSCDAEPAPTPTDTEPHLFLLSDIFPYHEDNRLVGVQILSVDVTVHKEIEAQMLQAQKLESVGTLARGIAHDFNNILNGIGGFLYLIESNTSHEGKILANCGRIKELTARATRLTRQLQTYTRQGRTEKRTLDLNEIVRQSVELLRASVGADRVQIEPDLSEGLEWIEGDFSQVEQVIMNLCLNGVEAISESGTLTIRTRTETIEADDLPNVVGVPGAVVPPSEGNTPALPPAIHYSVLEIRDTGCGMTPQVKARVFDPFYTTKKSGNGLGLSAVYGVLKAHRALVRVDSEPGIGTCFTVFFPASERKQQVLGDASLASVRGGNETILVADDEESIRVVSEDMLKTLGYRVILADDGDEAVRIFQERPHAIDLVIMDMSMPNLNGHAAAKVMCLARPDLRVLLMSGYVDDADIEALHEEGFRLFLTKPYSMVKLQETVRMALDQNDGLAAMDTA
jgi:PAS domain S-box-containing protein